MSNSKTSPLRVVGSTSGKVKSLPEIVEIAERARREGKVLVTTSGCFDLLHAGHVQTLEWSRAQGDVLIVGINSDRSVRAHKGPKRPILSEEDRALVLAGLAAVDYVFVFDTESPIPWIRQIKPAIQVKGGESVKSPLFRPEEEEVQKNGGRVLLAPHVKGVSTSEIIEKIMLRER